MRATKLLVGAGLIAGATAAAAYGVQRAGRRIAATSDPSVDDLLEPPGDVTHHHLSTFDGGTLHVVEKGPKEGDDGRPIVLMHGVTLQWDVWAGVFSELADDHRVIAWDMRGHGGSAPGDEGVTMSAIGTDVVTMLSDLDLTDAVVVGHSMGGMGLARFCADHIPTRDRRVAHAVFLSTSASPLNPIAVGTAAQRAVVDLFARGTRIRRRESWQESDLNRVMLRVAYGRDATGRAVADLARMGAEMDPDFLADAGMAIGTHDVVDDLREVELPSTVITGSLDRLTPPRHARALAEALPSADLVLLPGIGHQVMQEDPRGLSEHLRTLAKG